MITVRAAAVEDIPFIKEMMWEAILGSPLLVRSYGLEELRQRQEQQWEEWSKNPRPAFIAVDETGRKLGALSLRTYLDFRRRSETWELAIGVAPEARRPGVGQSLIQHALDFCRATQEPYLVLTVDPANRVARALYRKMGFKITSKRHDVHEMRFSFEPAKPEDPQIVANRRYFIQYWTNAQYYTGHWQHHHCSPYHVQNKSFERVGLKPYDWVYVVTVVKGEMYLIVKYEVDKLLTLEEAKAEFSKVNDLDLSTGHLLTRRATLYSFEPPLEAEVTQTLRLLHKGQPQPLPFNAASRLDGHSLRGVREITRESASLLDGFVEQFRPF